MKSSLTSFLLIAALMLVSACVCPAQVPALAAAPDQAPLAPAAPSDANGPGQAPFIGLQPGLGSLPLLGRGRTRSISAENPTGERGRGGMAVPDPTEPKPAASARAADDLGQG